MVPRAASPYTVFLEETVSGAILTSQAYAILRSSSVYALAWSNFRTAAVSRPRRVTPNNSSNCFTLVALAMGARRNWSSSHRPERNLGRSCIVMFQRRRQCR